MKHFFSKNGRAKLCILSALLTLFISFYSISQTPELEWVAQTAGTTDQHAYSVFVDESGSVYSCGIFTGTIDLNPGVATANFVSNGFWDVYIQKLDANGNYVWGKTFGGAKSESVNVIKLDETGNIILGGSYVGTVDFDPGPGVVNMTESSNTYSDAFLLKLNNNGDFNWAIGLGTGSESVNDLTITSSNEYIATGKFSGLTDFDPGAGVFNISPTSSNDSYLLKLTDTGNFIWAKNFGGTNTVSARNILQDASGNIYLTGSFNGNADMDPSGAVYTLTSNGSADIFVEKLNPSGNFVWAVSLGSTGIDEGIKIGLDPANNIIVGGRFYNTVDFNPAAGVNNLTSVGNEDAFILKLNNSGQFMWVYQIGGLLEDRVEGISVDAIGNIYSAGYFEDAVDFDNGAGIQNRTSAGNYDTFILKLNAFGQYNWVQTFGGSGIGIDWVRNCMLDGVGNLYTVGSTTSTNFDIDFGP